MHEGHHRCSLQWDLLPAKVEEKAVTLAVKEVTLAAKEVASSLPVDQAMPEKYRFQPI